MPRPEHSPPPDTKVASGSQSDTSHWVLKVMSDLREDLLAGQKKTEKTLERIDNRLERVEGKVSKLFWGGTAVVATLAVLWAGYAVFAEFFDVTITSKP